LDKYRQTGPGRHERRRRALTLPRGSPLSNGAVLSQSNKLYCALLLQECRDLNANFEWGQYTEGQPAARTGSGPAKPRRERGVEPHNMVLNGFVQDIICVRIYEA